MHIAKQSEPQRPNTYEKLNAEASRKAAAQQSMNQNTAAYPPINTSVLRTQIEHDNPDNYTQIEEKEANENMSSSRRRRQKVKIRKTRRIAKVFIGFLLFVLLGVSASALGASVFVVNSLKDLPTFTDLDRYATNGITTIYAADEQTVLARVYLENRIKVESNEIPDIMKDAVVSIEDERFFEHEGVDFIAVGRAILSNLKGNSQGGSTLTQQLVRNTVLIDEMQERTIERKIREMYIAHEIERLYSKDELLTLYLNVVNFGDGCYGVEAASRDYFGKTAAELSLSEAALLAGIPNSPTANNPRVDYNRAYDRSTLILFKMLELGYIDQSQYDEALANKPVIVEETEIDDGEVKAPYFVDYVKNLASNDSRYNASNYSHGGLTIYTTLDMSKQQAAEEAVIEGIEPWEGMDSSLTSIDPSNGYVVAMVGGKNYAENSFNLAVQMRRQPGSCFKPFTLMAAMTMGCSPDTQIDSTSPVKITDNWTVANSEGEGYGKMTLKAATTNSVNTVYAQLAHRMGAQPIVDMAKACGITSSLAPTESICLGTQGVCTMEMASAYATLAAGGVHHDIVAITKVVDEDGEVVFEHEDNEGERVMSEAMAAKTTEILQTVINEGTGKRAKLDNQPLAGKTGTSEEARDLWFVGYCPQLSTAIWSGHREEQPTNGYGGSVSAPIFKIYADKGVLGDRQDFPSVDTSSLKFTDEWKFD